MTKTSDLQQYVEWDARNWSRAVDFWLANSGKRLSDCAVLELGTDVGGLSLWLASQGAKVLCSDLRYVREAAIERHKASPFAHLIEHEGIDACDIPYSEKFDIVVFKSVIGMIGNRDLQKKAVSEMHKALKKDGELFFAENLVASPAHMFFRRKMIRWGNTWRYITTDEMKDFLAPFSQTALKTIGFAGTFGRNESQRKLLGLADNLVFERVVPERWKYIIAGVAKK